MSSAEQTKVAVKPKLDDDSSVRDDEVVSKCSELVQTKDIKSECDTPRAGIDNNLDKNDIAGVTEFNENGHTDNTRTEGPRENMSEEDVQNKETGEKSEEQSDKTGRCHIPLDTGTEQSDTTGSCHLSLDTGTEQPDTTGSCHLPLGTGIETSTELKKDCKNHLEDQEPAQNLNSAEMYETEEPAYCTPLESKTDEGDPMDTTHDSVQNLMASLPIDQEASLDGNTDMQNRGMKKQYSDQDTESYRQGYPGKEDDPKLKANLRFYMGEIKSKPKGAKIDVIHKKWKGKYKHLEEHHGYIQWFAL